MPQTFTPENRAQLVHQLTDFLSQITVQALRQAARQWGWSLKGTAKAEIVEQMTGYLGDARRMGAAFEKMPEEEREVLTWLRALSLASDPAKPLHAALAQGGGRQVTQKTVSQALQTLMERGLLIYDEYQGYRVPALFGEWLPPVDAPRLLHQGEPGHAPTFTLAEINQHVQHLLSAVETDRPEVLAAAQPGVSAYLATGRGSEIVTPRPGLVGAETLNRWGYLSADELHLARFLLDQMTGGGLCRITTRGPGKQMEVVPEASASWEEAAPAARLQRLRQWWLQSSPRPGGTPGTASTWNELDLALHQVKDYALRPVGYWSTADQWSRQVAVLRAWLLGLASALPPDTWHNVERLSNLVYHLHRDLLNWEAAASALRWHQDKTPLDPNQMRLEIWRETYGRLIEAWLSGPATWLGYVQVGYAGGRPIAFRYRSRVPAGDLTAMPPRCPALPLCRSRRPAQHLADRRAQAAYPAHRRPDRPRPGDHDLSAGRGRVPADPARRAGRHGVERWLRRRGLLVAGRHTGQAAVVAGKGRSSPAL